MTAAPSRPAPRAPRAPGRRRRFRILVQVRRLAPSFDAHFAEIARLHQLRDVTLRLANLHAEVIREVGDRADAMRAGGDAQQLAHGLAALDDAFEMLARNRRAR